MANAPFPIIPELTAIAVRYRNQSLIADQVLPRVPVARQEFKYVRHTLAEGFTLPETRVGRRSRPNMVEFSATEVTASCADYALDDAIPDADVANAAPNMDPVGRAVEGLSDLIALDREKRVADLVFSSATYPAGNKVTLSGTSQWSDFTASNPIDAILAANDTLPMRANVLVLGQAVWTKLRQHPRVVQAVYGSAQNAGVVNRQQVAELLELSEILVGQGFLNTAKKGQTPSLSRVWGKHAALIHRDGLADTRGNRTTFGFTAQWGERIAGTIRDPNVGMRGGTVVRVGESVAEVIAAPDLGYLFENAVA
jgi:hypothetical protein